MSALKRLHEMQQSTRPGKLGRQEESPAKRLKSSHTKASNNKTFTSILGANGADRKKLSAATTNGVLSKAASKVDETRATVATNANVVDTGSDAIDISSEEDSDEDESVEEGDAAPVTHKTNGTKELALVDDDVEMTNGVEVEEEEDAEPSFGDMLKARNPDVIDVHAQLPDPHAEPPHLEPASGKGALIRPVTGHSLTTVLQQALKTNDKDMLESCFHLRDVQAIRNTIQRLPSPLVGNLLTRISERIYRRPGRSGSLMIWIQWSLVAHGGYLASQPEILRKLKALNQVVRQRAQGLQSLVQLKAKLDMLNAQLELRRGVQSQRLRGDAEAEDDGVLYIEGQDDSGSDVDNLLAIEASKAQPDDSDDEIDDINAALQDDDEAEDDENLLDIEAEETSNDEDSEGDEDNSDEASASEEVDDDDEGTSEDESEAEIKAPRPQTLNRKR